MPVLYRLHPMQWMRDHNHLIEILSAEIRKLFPDLMVVEDTADKLTFPHSGGEYYINECELLLDLGDRIIGVTFLDNASKLLELIRDRDNSKDRLVYSQPDNFAPDLSDRLIRGVYVTQSAFANLDAIYRLRRSKTSFTDKFVFRGNYGAVGRGSIPILMQPQYESIFAGPHHMMNPQEYFEEIIQYKAGLSLPGIGEFCYRDLEYMAIGLPMLRFDYEFPLNPPLLPNTHYISIPRPPNTPWLKEREGGQDMADAYVRRFNEVKGDAELLERIAINAKQYYEDYFSQDVRVERTLQLMGL